MEKPPKYIMLCKTEMRYRERHNDYYRDAGHWKCGYKYLNGQLVSDIENHPRIHEKPMTEITEEEWREANKHYL